MPTYIFNCEDCGTTFEVRASIQEKIAGLQPKCPECNSERSNQLITNSFVIRNGGSSVINGCNPGGGCCG